MTDISCPHCGQAHPAGARFCPVSGKPITGIQVCRHCGGKIREGWNACPHCGRPLERQPSRKGLIWTAVAIFGLVLIVAGGYLVLGNQASESPASQDTHKKSTAESSQATVMLADVQHQPGTIEPVAEVIAVSTPSPARATPSTSTLTPTQVQGAIFTHAAQTIVAQLTKSASLTPTPFAYTAATQTVIAMLTEAARSALTPSSTLPGINPLGKIVFTCQIFRDPARNQICMMNADGSEWVRLTKEDFADHTYPSFSPDGQSIVFANEIDDDHQIYEMDLAGNQRQLTDLSFGAYTPAISPDNRWIVFTGNDGRQQTLWLMNRDGSNPHSLTRGEDSDAFDPAWSPDGSHILFASNQAGGIQLFAMNIDGSDLHQVTQMSDLRGRSDWAPDGEAIVTYAGSSWHREIIILGKDGKQLAQITDGGNNLAPNYSPDGQWIAFTSYRDNPGDNNGCEIYIMRVDGSQVTRLAENDYCDWQPNWGP
jgi:TolB protein